MDVVNITAGLAGNSNIRRPDNAAEPQGVSVRAEQVQKPQVQEQAVQPETQQAVNSNNGPEVSLLNSRERAIANELAQRRNPPPAQQQSSQQQPAPPRRQAQADNEPAQVAPKQEAAQSTERLESAAAQSSQPQTQPEGAARALQARAQEAAAVAASTRRAAANAKPETPAGQPRVPQALQAQEALQARADARSEAVRQAEADASQARTVEVRVQALNPQRTAQTATAAGPVAENTPRAAEPQAQQRQPAALRAAEEQVVAQQQQENTQRPLPLVAEAKAQNEVKAQPSVTENTPPPRPEQAPNPYALTQRDVDQLANAGETELANIYQQKLISKTAFSEAYRSLFQGSSAQQQNTNQQLDGLVTFGASGPQQDGQTSVNVQA